MLLSIGGLYTDFISSPCLLAGESRTEAVPINEFECLKANRHQVKSMNESQSEEKILAGCNMYMEREEDDKPGDDSTARAFSFSSIHHIST